MFKKKKEVQALKRKKFPSTSQPALKKNGIIHVLLYTYEEQYETKYIHSPLKPFMRTKSNEGEHGILMSKCKGQTCLGRGAY